MEIQSVKTKCPDCGGKLKLVSWRNSSRPHGYETALECQCCFRIHRVEALLHKGGKSK